MTSEHFIGWELMFQSLKEDVRTKEDIIMALIHWVLIKSRFRCIGLSDSTTSTVNSPGSELLPKGWNKEDTFDIKYKKENQLFILRGQVVDEEFVITLKREEDEGECLLNLKPADLVMACSGELESMVPTCGELSTTLRRKLVAPLAATSCREASVQTHNEGAQPIFRTTSERPLAISPGTDIEPSRAHLISVGSSHSDPFPHHPLAMGSLFDPFNAVRPRPLDPSSGETGGVPDNGDPPRAQYVGPNGVGSSDLNPFPHLHPGQGSVFDPFNGFPGPIDPGAGVPGGLPRGAVPPGARFEPFGPLGISPRPQRFRLPSGSDELIPDFENMLM